MRIFHVLDKIENTIYNSKKLPWSDYVLVKKDKILNLIEKTRQSLPQEMKQARWVTMENQRILKDAQGKASDVVRESEKRAEKILNQAQEEKNSILDKEQIVIEAKARAEELLYQARVEAEALMGEAKMRSQQMLQTAESKSMAMTMKAREDAEITREGADEYALKILSGMEGEFSRILSVLKKSKSALLEASEHQKKASRPAVEANQESLHTRALPRIEPATQPQDHVHQRIQESQDDRQPARPAGGILAPPPPSMGPPKNFISNTPPHPQQITVEKPDVSTSAVQTPEKSSHQVKSASEDKRDKGPEAPPLEGRKIIEPAVTTRLSEDVALQAKNRRMRIKDSSPDSSAPRNLKGGDKPLDLQDQTKKMLSRRPGDDKPGKDMIRKDIK